MSADHNIDKYAWAEHLHWMEGGMEDKRAVPEEEGIWKGLLLTGVIAGAAVYLKTVPLWPFTLSDGTHPLDPIVLSILLGMILGNCFTWSSAFRPGIIFAIKSLLPVGIIFLGARLDFRQLGDVGSMGLLITIGFVVVTLGLFYFLVKIFPISKMLTTLLGVGTAICGGTAIVAVAPVIKAKEDQVALCVATVSLLGLIGMLIAPFIGSYFSMSDHAYGVWMGLTIHQTPQVIAAGFAHSAVAGEVATVIKLARVCMLAPVVLLLAILFTSEKEKKSVPFMDQVKKLNLKRFFPFFIFGFLMMALARTMGIFPEIDIYWSGLIGLGEVSQPLSVDKALVQISGFLLAVSMVGVGLETKLTSIRKTSWKPFGVAAIGWVILCGISFLLVQIAIGK